MLRVRSTHITTWLLLLACGVLGQQPPSAPRVRIFISDMSSHDVWASRAVATERGTANPSSASVWGLYAAYAGGGNYPQMPEAARAFLNSCPEAVTVTTKPADADYMFLINHERFKGLLAKHNKVVLVNRAGDVVWGAPTRKLDNAVADACSFVGSGGNSRKSAKKKE